jgi:hypothetical protein
MVTRQAVAPKLNVDVQNQSDAGQVREKRNELVSAGAYGTWLTVIEGAKVDVRWDHRRESVP